MLFNMQETLLLLNSSEFSDLGDSIVRLKSWLTDSCIDDESKEEIAILIKNKNILELRDRFYRELEFGTGGLRGIMGAGNNRMNKYVVRRATQGLANYIKKQGENAMTKGVAISYDSRKFSDLFSFEVASVLAANSINVYIYKTLNTTPALSFAVRHLNCISGICVTASHNPPQYNGYKVYWNDGAQIIPPVDEGILTEVFAIKSFAETKYINFEEGIQKGLIKYISEETEEAYFKSIDALKLYPNCNKDIKIVYTPLHGTGAIPAKKIMQRWGFNNFFLVEEQEKPDAKFPTVTKPNPEEPAALALAVKKATEMNADVVMATDPDSDRFALVVNDNKATHGIFSKQSNGNFVYLSGNQTAAVIIDHILSGYKAQNKLKSSHKIIKTIVTSDLLTKICDYYNVEIFNTLTGFKWIAGLVRSWEDAKLNDHDFLFGTEESFGYMPGTYVRDKDGIAILALVAEITSILKEKNLTICDKLQELFNRHGVWQEDLINIDLVGETGLQRIARIMETFRNNASDILVNIPVIKIFDYKTKQIYTTIKNKGFSLSNEKLNLPVSDVLQFELIDGSKISMRPSGTEPKIKFYISVCTKLVNIEEASKQTWDKIEKLRKEILSIIEKIK